MGDFLDGNVLDGRWFPQGAERFVDAIFSVFCDPFFGVVGIFGGFMIMPPTHLDVFHISVP